MHRTTKKLMIVAAVVIAMAAYFFLDLGRYLSLAYLQQQLDIIHSFYAENRLLSWLIFLVVYVVVTALSIPGAAVMTLAGGAIFGFVTGLVLVSFASAIGATLAFLVARYLLRDWVQQRFGDRLKTINQGIEKDGAFYLFTLRLVPVFPFFLINLVMALTPLKTWTFYWVSQVGMLAGTAVYINAGTQVAQLQSAGDILSPGLIGAFVLLGLFPWIARALLAPLQREKVYRGWEKPKHFDRNLIVIGAGSGGLVSAYIGATVKAGVTLVEKESMGGDCLNTGCVPSKALIKSAQVASMASHSPDYGLKPLQPEANFGAVMDRIQRVIKAIEPHDSVERYRQLGVDCRQGSARLVSPWAVEITGNEGKQTLTARNIIIASGAAPLVPPFPGLEQIDYLTTETLWKIRNNPGRLLILGGGPIGCELAQAFARLGTRVTQVEMLPRILPREDDDAAKLVADALRRDGVELLLNHKADRFAVEGGDKVLYTQHQGESVRLVFDQILIAIGRKANTDGLGLEALGITTHKNGTIALNAFLQTRFPNIYAVGDVAGPYQFTHTAAHQAWYAAVNALFGRFKKFRVDYSVIPWATFTSPEVARVGLNEQDAAEEGVEFEVTRYGIDDLDRAITDGCAEGFVKVLTRPGSDRILGVTIVGNHAGDLIAEYVLAMKHGLGLNKILGTIHIYPTLAEANKFAAGEWKKAHAPQGLLKLVERYHRWQR
ncbi:FAD-dependent oxidoreductase [uncultured Porticoccus sp.]|uniref:FAD-dependent oxidoreductase n=1 Tax=uncultured Porticoccus sp. TaxID=1256050 RepID=UPI0030D8EBD3